MIKKEKIKGVPVDECSKYVWSLVNSIKFKDTGILTKEDLFQVGFLELVKRSKDRYKKNGRMHLVSMHDCIYFTILKEIEKHRYPVKVPSYVATLTRKLRRLFKDLKYYNEETCTFDYNELNASNLESFEYKRNLTKSKEKVVRFLCRENTSFQMSDLAKGIEYLQGYNYDNASTVTEDLYVKEVYESLLNVIINLNVIKKHKQIFIAYYGLNGDRLTGEQVAKKYGVVLNSAYRIVRNIKEMLINEGSWITENFGKTTLNKLRRN